MTTIKQVHRHGYGPPKGSPVNRAAGSLGMAIRWGGDVAAARQLLILARLEKHIRDLAPELTIEQRAGLTAVLIAPNAA